MVVHPVLFTGRYYDFTVRSVEYDPLFGHVTLTYDDVVSYGAEAKWEYAMTKYTEAAVLHDWGRRPRSFLFWPRKDKSKTLGFFLTTDAEREKGLGDSPAIRQRLELKEGTYRVRSGERMEYFHGSPDGSLFPWHIEVKPLP